MRVIGFLSDVHSNLEALDRVMAELRGLEVVCLGDAVGYGSNPNEVIKMLKEANAIAVRGNHDDAVLTGDTSWFNARAAMALQWTRDHLTAESMSYLRGLPLRLRLELEGTPVFLTHGSPDDNLREYVEPQTHSQLFAHYLDKLNVRAIALGHTHRPFVWKEAERLVFNPGSAGQPRDGDPRASYAVATFDGRNVDVELRRVEYDIETAARKIEAAGLPGQLAARLFEGV